MGSFAEVGHFALVLALVVAVLQSVLPIWGAIRDDGQLMAVAGPAAHAQFVLVFLAFGALTYGYVFSDFSLNNVWQNSHSTQPLLYKFTSVWGNHEGSVLLWALILALFGSLLAAYSGNLPDSLRANVLAVQALIGIAFLLFILLTSNPFERLVPPPVEGRDLNPILQDIGLAIHPPLLYLGYVGFSIAFSFAIAALIDGRIDSAWARWVRPWTLAAWIFLTLGISMGSYWAYYELGWGGYWFWDPVENASFMPWLSGTALLHSAIVMEKRNALKIWTVLLAILTFSLSLLGTFLVRSGVLTSVHAFATDPTRGLFILVILMIFIGGALALFAWRAPMLKQGGLFQPISREGSLVFNNLFLVAACSAVLIGTLYPLALETFTGTKISVGAPFFNMTFGPLMVPVLLVAPIAPFLTWKRADLLAVGQRVFVALILTLLSMVVFYAATTDAPIMAVFGLGLGIWVIFGSLAEIAFRSKLGKAPLGESLRRARNLPRSAWGAALGHVGLGVVLVGLVVVTAFEKENILYMKEGQTAKIGPYEVRFNRLIARKGPNFNERVAQFSVLEGGTVRDQVESSQRIYTARKMPTTETGIVTYTFSQVYVAIADPTKSGALAVRLYYKPWVTWIWLGTLIMSFGGLLSLSDRRLRVGAPRPSAKKQKLQPAKA